MKHKIDFPCLDIKMVKREDIVANNYNPNSVPKHNMELLQQSIIDNGFCFPVVTIWDEDLEKYVIIDGFHRYTICSPEWLDITQIPIVVLKHDINKRMAATIQFNRARGVHQVELMSDLVRSLIQQGQSEEEICKHLGMEAEEVLRLKQITGIAEIFSNGDYSRSWSMEDVEDE